MTKQEILKELRRRLYAVDGADADGRFSAMTELYTLSVLIEKDIQEQDQRFVGNPPYPSIQDISDKIQQLISEACPGGCHKGSVFEKLNVAAGLIRNQADRLDQQHEDIKANLKDHEEAHKGWRKACELLHEAFHGPCTGMLRPGFDLIEDGIPVLVAEIERLRLASETKAPVLPVENKPDMAEDRLRPLAEMLLSLDRSRAKEASIHQDYGDYRLTYTVRVGAAWE